MHKTIAGIALLSLLLLASCQAREGFAIEGTLRDAETGEEVSREHVYLHFFCDEIDFQNSLEQRRTAGFDVTMPKPKVRVRAYDDSLRYHLFEQTVEIEGTELEFDIRLVPTHYVLLTGRVIDSNTGKVILPRPGIGNTPLVDFHTKSGLSSAMIGPASDGTYSVRVPREKLTITVLDSPLGPKQPILDLTGHEGMTYSFDLKLE